LYEDETWDERKKIVMKIKREALEFQMNARLCNRIKERKNKEGTTGCTFGDRETILGGKYDCRGTKSTIPEIWRMTT
jgi:hypothetical protein